MEHSCIQPSQTNSPLIDVANSYLSECCSSIEQSQKDVAFDALKSYINGLLTYEAAAQRIKNAIQTTSPIDKIRTILTVDENPLPPQENTSINGIDPLSSTYGINSMSAKRKLNPWDPLEDARLLAAIHRYGVENWIAVAKFVGNSRTRAQCSQRWNRGLDPHLKKCRWTAEEEEKLQELVNLHGLKAWTQISQKLGNRSDVQCRYHYNQMMKSKTLKTASMPIANAFSSSEYIPITPPSAEKSPISTDTPKPLLEMKEKANALTDEFQKEWGYDVNPDIFSSFSENIFDFEENMFL